MNALLYIIRKSIKNNIIEIIKKPAKLILYLLIIAFIIGIGVMSVFTRASVGDNSPIWWFQGILFAFISMVGIVSFTKGLSGGDAIFEMNDVNLLFVSPINARKILLYGLVRITKTAFFSGFFILFQSQSLAFLGIDYSGVLVTFFSFLLAVMVLTTSSLLIYTITNGNKFLKNITKLIILILFIPLIAFSVIQYFKTGDLILTADLAVNSPYLRYIPIIGWTSCGVTDILSGEILKGLLFLGLNVILFIGFILYIMLSNSDYYEDVLVATETAFEKKRALAEGNLGALQKNGKSVKISATGIFGKGAGALFGKHTRESFRENKFGFFGMPSFFIILGSIVLCFFIKDLTIVMQILMWVQIMYIGTGRGLKDTYSHYVYMIPESSFKKIIWSNAEIMARVLVENILIFVIGGIIIGANPIFIILTILVYTLFSFLLLGINYLSMRFLGSNVSMGLLVIIYYLAIFLIMAPGIIVAIITSVAIGENLGLLFGLIILGLWELIAGLICFFLARGVLHDCDMPSVRIKQ